MSNSPTPRKKPVKQSAPVPIPMSSLDLSDVEETGVGEAELSKDSVFLVEAAVINESVEMNITTSVVPSPARVVRHVEFPVIHSGDSEKAIIEMKDERLNTASKNVFFPASRKAEKNKLGIPPYLQSAKRLDFGSSNPTSAMTKDTKTKPPPSGQVKKTGRIVPSKYMQPRAVVGGKAEMNAKKNPESTVTSIIEQTQPLQIKLEESTRLEKRGPKGSTPVRKNPASQQSGSLNQEDWDFSIDLSVIGSHDSRVTSSTQEADVSMANSGSDAPLTTTTKLQNASGDLTASRSGRQLARAQSLQQPRASILYNRVDTEKKMKAKVPDKQEELPIDLLYGRYLQWVYLDAMAEKAFKKQEPQAMTQLMAARELVAQSREEEERVKKVNQEKEERRRLIETLQVLEETLPPILSLSSKVLEVHDAMSGRLDSVRDVMPCKEVCVPSKEEDRRAYEDDIRQALVESVYVLTDILGSTEKGQQMATDAREGEILMTDLSCVVDGNRKAMEEYENLIKETVQLSLDETALKIQLNLHAVQPL